MTCPNLVCDSIAAHLSTKLPRRHASVTGNFLRHAVHGCTVSVLVLRLVALSNHFADVSIKPQALELLCGHLASAVDAAAAVAGTTETVEWLGHGPLGGRVEECKLVTDLETLGASKEGQRWNIEDLRIALALDRWRRVTEGLVYLT